MKKYIGKIIDNSDPDQEGKCQVYVEYLHHGFQPSQYPWFRQDRFWTSDIPEIDDLVWVWFYDEKFYKKGYYGNKLTLKEYHTHNQTIGSMTSAYPNVKYIQLANGNAIAMSSDSDKPEITIYHSSGTELFIDSDGNISINGVDLTITSSGDVTITGNSLNLLGATEAFVKGTTFDTWLQNFITVTFNTHVHTGVTTGGGSSGVPAPLATAPTNHLSTTIKGE